jgi:hypothetical protein
MDSQAYPAPGILLPLRCRVPRHLLASQTIVAQPIASSSRHDFGPRWIAHFDEERVSLPSLEVRFIQTQVPARTS